AVPDVVDPPDVRRFTLRQVRPLRGASLVLVEERDPPLVRPTADVGGHGSPGSRLDLTVDHAVAVILVTHPDDVSFVVDLELVRERHRRTAPVVLEFIQTGEQPESVDAI